MIRLVIWVIIGLLALSFFGISLEGLVENPTNQGNVSYVLHLISEGWNRISEWIKDIPDAFDGRYGS